ncbi:hypothetical protein BDQ17DRAFT_1325640 [Cyathus striatus]|nr:hypothetical protein BDQ17DRAFT_1325640 [Cyathus striatus]
MYDMSGAETLKRGLCLAVPVIFRHLVYSSMESIMTERTRAPSFASTAASGQPTTSDLHIRGQQVSYRKSNGEHCTDWLITVQHQAQNKNEQLEEGEHEDEICDVDVDGNGQEGVRHVSVSTLERGVKEYERGLTNSGMRDVPSTDTTQGPPS